jgi:uncharacterized protein
VTGAGSPLAPVSGGERLGAVDVLRGFALLGILPINIYSIAMPALASSNPLLWGGAGIHLGTWIFTHIVFELKFMAIFTMLFGAGLILMTERAEARGAALGKIFYRRMLWLLVIGLIHSYFIWYGDILVNYALCGMLLFPLRRLRPRTLVALACIFLGISLAVILGLDVGRSRLQQAAERAEARLAAGETLTDDEARARQAWAEKVAKAHSGPEEVADELRIFRGGYRGIFEKRLPLVLAMQTFMWIALAVWRTGGLMLLGMALMKWGFLRGVRDERSYKRWALVGYGLGLPIVVFGVARLVVREFDPLYYWGAGIFYNYLGSVLVGVAHAAVVMLAVKRRWLAALAVRLAAVGRMTLTNYLMHSILLTTVFYGYGFGLYGHVDRFYLMGFVLTVWWLQLYLSPVWLHRFRFGPVEWLWRSLTYWRRQPMRASSNPEGVAYHSPG